MTHVETRTDERDQLADCQRGFLLLQLLGARDREMPQGEANKVLKRALFKRRLELTPGKANELRREMADCVAIERRGRTTWFRITDEGVRRLLHLPQYPADLPINGRAIERLLDVAVRAAPGSPPPAAGSSTGRPSARAIVLSTLDRVRAERAHRRLVPIHELRARVQSETGGRVKDAEFEAALRDLWRRGEVELVPISDGRDATREQLDQSIRGVHEILFYVERIER